MHIFKLVEHGDSTWEWKKIVQNDQEVIGEGEQFTANCPSKQKAVLCWSQALRLEVDICKRVMKGDFCTSSLPLWDRRSAGASSGACSCPPSFTSRRLLLGAWCSIRRAPAPAVWHRCPLQHWALHVWLCLSHHSVYDSLFILFFLSFWRQPHWKYRSKVHSLVGLTQPSCTGRSRTKAGWPGKALACVFWFGLVFFHPDPFLHFLKNGCYGSLGLL